MGPLPTGHRQKRPKRFRGLNILFVADVSVQDELSGAERVLLEQATRLAARGHHVDILTRRLPSHLSDHFRFQDVTEWRYPVDRRNAISFFSSTLRNGIRLFETLNATHHYDCINLHQPFSAFAVGRSPASRTIRTVYTCLSLSCEEYVSRNPKPQSLAEKIIHIIHRSARKCIEKKALNAAHQIVVLSRYTIDKLTNMHGINPRKIVVIPGGIDLERFHPAQDKLLTRAKLNLPRDKTILLTVRGLEPRMGIENLIRAMQAVVKTIPDVYLIVGGAGPLKDALFSMCRSLNLDHHIEFPGYIPEAELPLYYQAADLFILPTIELEGFGLVTLEALASGTPVLGTPIGGTLEILGALDERFLFQDISPESISGLIIKMCEKYRAQPDQWQIDSSRCRRFAEQYYSWETNVTLTERLFRGHP